MALTGLEIYKQLPKKNCGECGPPTCLAFAMLLAGGKASLDSCPYVTDEARATLESASAPPIAKVVVGAGDHAITMGDETELFRHDKKFYHETAMAFRVLDTLSEKEITARTLQINELVFVRVGLEYRVQSIAIENASGDPDQFGAAVTVVARNSVLPIILISQNVEAIRKALQVQGVVKPLIYAATKDNYEEISKLAIEKNCPLAVRGENLEELAEVAEKVAAMGKKDLILDPGARNLSRAIADLTQIRRLAIKKKYRPFGYPIISFTQAADPLEEAAEASVFISKYASMVVMNTVEKAHILPLLSWRQNLYTDPQVPIRVEEKLHAVGNVNSDSPVYITTNFSLTYYSVEGEVESSKIPSYILAVDTDGLSVLTAYADGKLEADKIAAVMKKCSLEEMVSHRNVVLPGLVAVLSGKLEEETGWNIIVGPREASGIPAFAKSQFA